MNLNNLMNNATFLSGLFSVSGMAVTGVVSYLVARNKSKSNLAMNDRQQLSKDEQQFRQEIYDRMKDLQEDVDKYHKKTIELEDSILLWKNKYLELDKEWRTKYTEIEIENTHLKNDVEVLRNQLTKMSTDKQDKIVTLDLDFNINKER
jgi:hypothetical protein